MTIDRAIEILDPEHRECYDGMDEVNEACRMGMEALGCTVTAEAEQTGPIKIWFENRNGPYNTLCIVDENTGVDYIVASVYVQGYLGGVAVTPRLNSDGTLYTTK